MTREEGDNQRDDMLIDGPGFANPNPNQVNSIAGEFNPNHLKLYYAKLFPYSDVFKWLSYGNDGKHPSCDQSYFGRREFSFTLDDEIYLRYQSFKSVAEFESAVKEKCPFKIDIGPVFSNDSFLRRVVSLVIPVLEFGVIANHAIQETCLCTNYSVERELVFDIDITDYDDVRFCCSGADVCSDCWPLMIVAIKVVDTALKDDFGFSHLLWVFSGRRGVHCWVCDPKARRLTNQQRAAIAEYFLVYKGNVNSHRKVFLGGPALHPFLARSYTEFLKDFFEETFLCSQKLLSSEERYEKILEMIPDESVTSDLRGKWQDSRRSSLSKEDINVVRWGQLKHILQSGKQKATGLRRCIEEIVFSYVYPRLDMEVSKHMNHLLKAPFCVHPKTGRVCVPIDPNRCEEFDPSSVPTLSRLLEELNTNDEMDMDRTTFGKSVAFFRSSFLQPLLKSCKDELENSYSKNLQQNKDSLNW